jgi:hypothetical protein
MMTDLALGLNDNDACVIATNNNVSPSCWKNLMICGNYQSSQNSSITIYWISEETNTAFGYEERILPSGKYYLCFSLFDAVTEWNNIDWGVELYNPIDGETIKEGVYLFEIKQGRFGLAQLQFSIND